MFSYVNVSCSWWQVREQHRAMIQHESERMARRSLRSQSARVSRLRSRERAVLESDDEDDVAILGGNGDGSDMQELTMNGADSSQAAMNSNYDGDEVSSGRITEAGGACGAKSICSNTCSRAPWTASLLPAGWQEQYRLRDSGDTTTSKERDKEVASFRAGKSESSSSSSHKCRKPPNIQYNNPYDIMKDSFMMSYTPLHLPTSAPEPDTSGAKPAFRHM